MRVIVNRANRARARGAGAMSNGAGTWTMAPETRDHRGRLAGRGLRALRAERTRASLGRRSDARDSNEKTDVPV